MGPILALESARVKRPPPKRPTLLLTGFEPFGDWTRNVTAEAVSALDGELRNGVTVRAVVLPVAWPRAAEVLGRALDRAKPAAVLAFGIHGKKRGAFRVETRAANELRFRIKDNEGKQFRGRAIDPRGERALEASLPAGELLAALRARGLSARCSRDAGRFLCNAVYYSILARDLPAAFIHVPPLEDGEDASAVFTAVGATLGVATRNVQTLPSW
jgi:pyroglutamyl-peptidase